MANYDDSEVIITRLYPLVEKALSTNSRRFLTTIGNFFNERHKTVHDIAPYVNILYNKNDEDKLFKAIGLEYSEVLNIIKNCFFYDLNYSPLAAKEPYVEVLMCAIKYYMIKNDATSAELVSTYTLFTGKFYASLYFLYFKFTPKREIMDYVINNMLTDKFDLKKEGTIFKAMRKLANTWINTYSKELKSKSITDDEIGKKLIQQLRDRENSFLKNIAILYYKAAEEKLYLNYETDDLSEDNFRLIDSDSNRASRLTEATTNILISSRVNLKRCEDSCNIAKGKAEGVKPIYIKGVMEGITGDKKNIPNVRRVANIIICDYLSNNPGARVGSIEFINYTMKPKSNTKNEILLELRKIITDWLMTYSEKYRTTTRTGTPNAFFKCILAYFTLTISEVANK